MAAPQKQKLEFLGGEEVEVAPQSDLPRTSFFSIEYPAILSQRDTVPEEESNQHPALSSALRSLSPLPPPYASTSTALRHLGQLINKNDENVIECRLGQACNDAASASTNADSSPTSTNDLYRHPVMGNVLDSHNIVLKVTKRVWRKKETSSQQQTASGSVTERREYTAVAMGITRHVARFRNPADYLYNPGFAEKDDSSQEAEEATVQALCLHDTLRQMDIEAIRSFQMDVEKEDYEVDKDIPGKGIVKVSNIKMPPPLVFEKIVLPFTYGFRQNKDSRLSAFGRKLSDGSQPMRYVNTSRYSGLAPIQVSMSGNSVKIPSGPLKQAAMSQKTNEELLASLKMLFARQPIWSRVALYNQFEPDQRRTIMNQRQYLAASCYAITDGCWRDTLVRFRYDPRESKESRFYQRITFQNKNKTSKPIPIQSQGKQTLSNADNAGLRSVNRQEVDAVEDEVDDNDSHIFDGVTPSQIRGNYLLLDVHDELIKPLIDQVDNVLRDEPDRETGWYTQHHYDKIRTLMQVRFRRLVEEGIPASKEECDAIVAQLDLVNSSRSSKTSTSRAK